MLTLDTFQVNPSANYTAPITLRWWYNSDFLDVDNSPVAGGSQNFFIEFECWLTDGVISVGAMDIFTTLDANIQNPQSINCSARFYQRNTPKDYLFTQWVVPSEAEYPGGVITFPQLAIYNDGSNTLANPPADYLTAAQTVAYFSTLSPAPDASALTKGITKLSVAPASASNPIAYGVNDPAVGDLHGTLTADRVPRANDTHDLVDGLPIDDGTDFSIPTTGIVQGGDYDALQNGSFFSVNDSLTEDGGRTVFQAGGSSGAEYAGVVADCSLGAGAVNVQTTGITNLYGANQITIIGDGLAEQNGTQVVVNDPVRMVVQSAVNQVPNDASIGAEQICFYLDEASNKLKVRVRYSDESYKTGEISLT